VQKRELDSLCSEITHITSYTQPIASVEFNPSANPVALSRTLNLRGAVVLNMLDMVGVGPFITLPLILAAMGGPQAMLGWIFGALLALCDGLVWAELGAAMPHAGGSYEFLRRIYPGATGRFLAFLFIFQLTFSAPLSVASGCIGLSQYATYLFPQLAGHTVTHSLQIASYSAAISIGPATLIAVLTVVLAVVLLYRKLAGIERLSLFMGSIVLVTIVWILLTGVMHAHWHQAFTFPAHAFTPTPAFFTGLGAAMLIATYDYWGYYNVTFLGGEVKDPARTIPRAILISIACVGAIYLLMNVTILAVLPWQPLLGAQNLDARRAIISLFMETAYGPHLGPLFGKIAAILVMLTAFASVFSLLLGYSRIPYAAARDGNFFRPFGRLHPTKNFPYVSLLMLGAAAAVFCCFSLKDVIAALVVLRIVLQFLMQHVGVLYLRRTQPDMPRPFRLWLYPLPPLVALAGFTFILLSRPNFERELILAGVLIVVGSVIFLLRSRFRPQGLSHPAEPL
jgi:amino acid transporter